MRDLGGKVAVVTGAASGIGRALAVLLAEHGCELALVDRDRAGIEATAQRVQALGRKVSLHEVDVSDREQMRALPERVIAEHGAVDLVVNNAGMAAGYSFEDHPIEEFERLISVNLMGVVYGCKFFLPHLLTRPEGHIVNLSSVFGFIGIPTHAAYCTSKFGVRGLSEALWSELGRTRVRVTCVHPGGVQTNIVRSASGWPQGVEQTQEQFEKAIRRSPERAARIIVRAIQRGKVRVRLGIEAYLIDWVVRLLPTVARRIPFDPGQGDRQPKSPVG